MGLERLVTEHPASEDGASIRAQDDRLDSWKKIASYLKRDVSTVQRWERREAMPVHRHLHDKLGSVFAYRSELDRWWESRRTRLTAEVAAEESAEAEATAHAAPSQRPPSAPAARWLVRLAATAIAVLLAIAAAVWFAAQSSYFWRNPLANARFIRLADVGGTQQAAVISRDGRTVAFVADRDGQTDVFVSEVGSGSYLNLTHGLVGELVNPAVRTLGFSADSSLVSIWTRQHDGSQPGDVSIVAVPIGGGALRPYLSEAAEFDWSRDGRLLVYHTTAPGDPLFVRDTQAPGHGADRRIYVAPAGVHCHFPVWSPDQAFIYFIRGVPPGDWDIWRIRPSGEGLERITRHSARVAFPVMLDDRTLLYLATDADGAGPWLYVLDLRRRIPHRVSSGLETYTSLGASTDGSRLVATVANPRTSLWRMALREDGSAAAPDTPVLLLENGSAPRFAPGFLLFVSSRAERAGIWAFTNGAAREVWGSPRARIAGTPAVAPDGRRIAFIIDDEGSTRLCVIDATGANFKVLTDSLALRGNPAWAPDGQSVLAAAVRDGEPHLTRVYLNGDAPGSLVSEYSVDPVWSPDGQFLVYSGADVGTTFPLRGAAADGRPYTLPSLMLTRGARRVAFLRSQGALVFLRGEIGHKDLWLLDLKSGGERRLAQLPQDFVVRDFDVSADGTEIVLEREQENSHLALIERQP
jgi:Tol biopolymer transport system component